MFLNMYYLNSMIAVSGQRQVYLSQYIEMYDIIYRFRALKIENWSYCFEVMRILRYSALQHKALKLNGRHFI